MYQPPEHDIEVATRVGAVFQVVTKTARGAPWTNVGEQCSVREAFALFLVEWLGGPNEYSAKHGHPRLRMRHAHVAVDASMRDAWLRCMTAALVHENVDDEVRDYLGRRFAEVADFLRNR